MRHFGFLTQEESAAIFAVAPRPFDRASPAPVLGVALGATLYSPATRIGLAEDATRAAALGATSHVWCLEDAISAEDTPMAQANVVRQLRRLHECPEPGPLPLVFVRVRDARQILEISSRTGVAIDQLTGFVLPKMAPDTRGERLLAALEEASAAAGQRLYGMPVLEHAELAWRETRGRHLDGLRALFAAHRHHLLALRVGGTDLGGLFGLRRDRDTTVWDVAVVRDVLADVLNAFSRRGEYLCAGPVWEHFAGADRLFKPQLRATPFERGGRAGLRDQILREDVDGLIREVLLDRQNGFQGKTVIHPRHVAVVNALHAVGREEYDDALAVLATPHGGASRSAAGNKMNEVGPHALWAEQVVARAAVYGVLARPYSVIELLQRGRTAADRLLAAGSRPRSLTEPVA